MKNVIVVTAILIFAMTVMSLYAELNAEIREKRLLTDLAEEAAATAALFYDENAYGYGRYRFDRTKAEAMAKESLRLNGFNKIAMSIEAYEKLAGRLELYSLIQEGMDDICEGRTQPVSDAMSEIKKKRNHEF